MNILCPSGFSFEAREWSLDDLAGMGQLLRSGKGFERALSFACARSWVRTIDAGPYHVKDDVQPDFTRVLKHDVLWATFQIRAGSMPDDPTLGHTGDDYLLEFVCPNKDAEHKRKDRRFWWAEKLSEITFEKLPETTFDAMREGRSISAKLPNDVEVKFDVSTIELDSRVEEYRADIDKKVKSKKDGARRYEEGIEYIGVRLRYVSALGEDGSRDVQKRVRWAAELPMRQFFPLRDAIMQAEPHLDTTINPECPDCGQMLRMQLPIQQSFVTSPDPFVKAQILQAKQEAQPSLTY